MSYKPTFKEFLTEAASHLMSVTGEYVYSDLGQQFEIEYEVYGEWSKGDTGDVYNPPVSKGYEVTDVQMNLPGNMIQIAQKDVSEFPSEYKLQENGLLGYANAVGRLSDLRNRDTEITFAIYGQEQEDGRLVVRKVIVDNAHQHEEYIRDLVEDHLNQDVY